MTKIRIDGTRLMARNGRRTRTVRIADRLRLSPGINDSTNLQRRKKCQNRIGSSFERQRILPRDNDETVQAIPGFSEITALSKYTHSGHFNAHLHRKESEDEIIRRLQPNTTWRITSLRCLCTRVMGARLVHAQSDTIQENDKHTDAFKPW